MSRYFTRPLRAFKARPRAAWWDDDPPMLPNIEASDHESEATGLLDKYGDEIWRAPNPMGFGGTLE